MATGNGRESISEKRADGSRRLIIPTAITDDGISMRCSLRLFTASLLVHLFIPYQILAENGPSYVSRVDWESGRFVIDVSLLLGSPTTPRSRIEAQERIEKELPQEFLKGVTSVQVSSSVTIGDLVSSQSSLRDRIKEMSLEGAKESLRFVSSLKEVRASYSFPLFTDDGLLDPLITHPRPFPLTRVLGFVATRPFSGIVIYAKGSFRSFGKSEEQFLQPALLPKIFDEDMNLVLEARMCHPESLRNWGMVAYTDTLDLSRFLPRVGAFPLSVMARGVFGRDGTDIIISKDSASKILALQENRDLLIQGRILIIYEGF
jgi:hypothetical protein